MLTDRWALAYLRAMPDDAPGQPAGAEDADVPAPVVGPVDHSASAGAGAGGSATGTIDQLKVIGGLIALCAGLLTLLIIVVVALSLESDSTGSAIATAAIGVVGSIVGAYFGVKIGTDGTQSAVTAQKQAVTAQQQEAVKAQVFALHTPSDKADLAVAQAERLLRAQNPSGSSGSVNG